MTPHDSRPTPSAPKLEGEALDKARAAEAWCLRRAQPNCSPGSAEIAARLAREGWYPPEPAPEPLKVGDRVQDRRGTPFTLLAIDGKLAWLRCPDGSHWTYQLANLTRAPKTEAGE